MAVTRNNRLELRTSEAFEKALTILKDMYPQKSQSDILHMALGDALRKRVHVWDNKLTALANELE